MNDVRSKSTKRCGSLLSTLLLTLHLVLASIGCTSQKQTDGQSSDRGKTNRVVAVSYALQYLTERIVGDTVEVDLPAPPDADPKTWKPTIADIKSLQSADLVVVNGDRASYAKWLQQVVLTDSKLCYTTDDFAVGDFAYIRDYQIVHTHGPEGEHSHPFSVPYCWLDPSLAKKQADKIAESLTKTYPELADTIESNLSELNADLDELAKEFRTAKVPFKSTFSANPLTKCFTRAIGHGSITTGNDSVSTLVEDNYLFLFDNTKQDDLEKSTQKLNALTVDGPPQTMLVTPTTQNEFGEFMKKLPNTTKIIVIQLLDHAPENGDYLTVMRENLQAITGSKAASN